MALACWALYTALAGLAFVALSNALRGSALAGWPLQVAAIIGWFLGLMAVGLLAVRRTLPLLADSPVEKTELFLVGARSSGTFQEVRARTLHGMEMKLIVDSRPKRFWEAVCLLEGSAGISG